MPIAIILFLLAATSFAGEKIVATPTTKTVDELCAELVTQKGGTIGYPDWENTILQNEPAASILALALNLAKRVEVVEALKKKIADFTPTKACHKGRGSGNVMNYTVSDIACYILVQLHDEDTIEAVVMEMKRRGAAGESPAPMWAIRYYKPIEKDPAK